MSAEREAEAKAREAMRLAQHQWVRDEVPVSAIIRAENAYAATIAARVDAEWRARVEGERVRWVERCRESSRSEDARDASEVAVVRFADALLTAVARDREGK